MSHHKCINNIYLYVIIFKSINFSFTCWQSTHYDFFFVWTDQVGCCDGFSNDIGILASAWSALQAFRRRWFQNTRWIYWGLLVTRVCHWRLLSIVKAHWIGRSPVFQRGFFRLPSLMGHGRIMLRGRIVTIVYSLGCFWCWRFAYLTFAEGGFLGNTMRWRWWLDSLSELEHTA